MNPETSAFIDAVKRGDADTVTTLLQNEPALANATTEQGISVLMLAYYHGQPDIGARIAQARDRLTIWEAAVTGDVQRVRQALAENPAQLNAHSADGFTPLGFAAFFGRLEALNALLAAGADPNIPAANQMNVRPIHSAAANRDLQRSLAAVQALIEHGALANIAQHGGWTPLHQAADHGNLPLVNLLLTAGADPTARSEDGRTPLDMARERGFDEVAARLNR